MLFYDNGGKVACDFHLSITRAYTCAGKMFRPGEPPLRGFHLIPQTSTA